MSGDDRSRQDKRPPPKGGSLLPDELPSDEGACEGEDAEPRPAFRKPASPREFVSSWSERDSLDGRDARAWVLILRTAGCTWARCTMCGYHAEAAPATEEDLMHQFKEALGRHRDEPIAKLYTSGSFFDELEVPAGVRRALLGELGRGFKKVVIETRPEFVTAPALEEATKLCPDLEVAIGLESASDRVLSHSVRKGFTFKDFTEKAGLIRRAGASVRAYLLLKPPFLTEREALDDAARSLVAAAPHCDTLSLNPVNIQRGTIVEQLWKRRVYRSPWLWTAAGALLEARRRICVERPDVRMVCSPSGAGQERGAHNCGLCDGKVIGALEEFSITQDASHLEKVLEAGCGCMDEWRDVLAAGAFAFISYDGLLRVR